MATDKSVTYLYTYGTSVAVRCDAPKRYREIGEGSICGIRVVDNKKSAIAIEEPVGSLMYLVEDQHGKAIEVPEQHLRALDD